MNKIDEIKQLRAQVESMTEQAKAEAIAKAREAIEVLRELGFANDTILKDLGFRARSENSKAKAEDRTRAPKDEPCPICNFRTAPPHDRRSHRGQNKKRPFTAEELEEKELTKL